MLPANSLEKQYPVRSRHGAIHQRQVHILPVCSRKKKSVLASIGMINEPHISLKNKFFGPQIPFEYLNDGKKEIVDALEEMRTTFRGLDGIGMPMIDQTFLRYLRAR